MGPIPRAALFFEIVTQQDSRAYTWGGSAPQTPLLALPRISYIWLSRIQGYLAEKAIRRLRPRHPLQVAGGRDFCFFLSFSISQIRKIDILVKNTQK